MIKKRLPIRKTVILLALFSELVFQVFFLQSWINHQNIVILSPADHFYTYAQLEWLDTYIEPENFDQLFSLTMWVGFLFSMLHIFVFLGLSMKEQRNRIGLPYWAGITCLALHVNLFFQRYYMFHVDQYTLPMSLTSLEIQSLFFLALIIKLLLSSSTYMNNINSAKSWRGWKIVVGVAFATCLGLIIYLWMRYSNYAYMDIFHLRRYSEQDLNQIRQGLSFPKGYQLLVGVTEGVNMVLQCIFLTGSCTLLSQKKWWHSRARIPVLIILAAVSGLCYLTLYYNGQLAKVLALPMLMTDTGILSVGTILLFICVNQLSEDDTSSPAEGSR
ncbi:hypothetical protein [Oscillibacter sp.]|uniref:hypothetical protein n=1 Tax=Oscillibacter sp. TaxID=1945593 RepID=UPI0033984869